MTGTLAVALAFAAIMLLVAATIAWREYQISREEESIAPSGAPMPIQWPTLASCAAPAGPLTVGEAHRAMQIHLECVIDTCGCKRAAWTTLVEEGRIQRAEYR